MAVWHVSGISGKLLHMTAYQPSFSRKLREGASEKGCVARTSLNAHPGVATLVLDTRLAAGYFPKVDATRIDKTFPWRRFHLINQHSGERE
jgi:hypothetical protein